MRIGTPEFRSSRLIHAREARGLTQTALAELTGLRVQSISQYESEKQTPSPDALQRLASALNQSERYFLKATPQFSSDAIKCRSQSAATKTSRTKAERKLSWHKEVYQALTEYVDFPPVNLPTFTLPSEPEELTSDRIEEITLELRAFWNIGLGPIDNLIFLLENNGVVVTKIALEADTLDALSQWDETLSRPFIMLGSDKGGAARSRFDAAHELGHIILHRLYGEKYIRKSATFKLMEDQAHRFAASFLLPESSFTNELWVPTLEAFASLKKHWRVSIATMISRCGQLCLISDEQSKRLWINLSRKGWRIKEPLDNILEPEVPRLFRNTFNLIIDAGVADKRTLHQDIGLNTGDIENLSCLPRGFFLGTFGISDPLISIKDNVASKRNVIAFPK